MTRLPSPVVGWVRADVYKVVAKVESDSVVCVWALRSCYVESFEPSSANAVLVL